MSDTRYSHLLPQEEPGEELAPQSAWFKAASGFLEVRVSYWVHERGILLCAVIEPPNNAPYKVWRRYWTSHVGALREAESLCGEIVEYLTSMTRSPLRETEDLDLDDFLEHLKTRLDNNFH